MVSSDMTNTLQVSVRRIKLDNGPVITTRKNKLKKKHAFQVDQLVVTWYDDNPAEHVVAHGSYLSKHGMTIHCNRVYHSKDLPKWIKEAINNV